MTPLVSQLRTHAESARDIASRVIMHRDAVSRYAKLVTNPDVAPLTKRVEKQIAEYAMDHFGSRWSASWLRFYAAFRGEFVEGWLPEDHYVRVVLPQVNGPYREVGMAKTLTRRMLSSDALPDLAYCVHGQWYDTEMEMLSAGAVKDLVFRDSATVIMKVDNAMQGYGVKVFDRADFKPDFFTGHSVVQRFIPQARWFDQIVSGSTCTLRVLSALVDGKPRFVASHLRAGRQRERAIIGTTKLTLAVSEQGKLGPFASDIRWKRYRSHPDSGFVFADQQVPRFAEAVELALSLHRKVPHFRLIGWDIAIPDSGPLQLLEWNMNHPGITFHEAASGPCFGWLKAGMSA